MKNLLLLFLALFLANATIAQLTGIKTIKATGGDYATFTAAVNDLNSSGVGAGGVTFNVDAGFVSVENCPVITATGTSANPIVFQKYGSGANPVIKPVYTFPNSAGIAIQGGDYFTFDGIDISTVFDPNGNNTYSFDFGYYILSASNANGAQYNTIKNCVITLYRGKIETRGIWQNIIVNPISAAGANSYNTYDNIFIQNSCWGIYLKGHTVNNDLSCVIKNCTIGAATANDIGNSITSSGIRVTGSAGINVFNNEIRNVTVTQGVLYGLWLENPKGTNNIYNNKIHDLISTHFSSSSVVYGIHITCLSSYTTVCNVYNNAVYALQHGATEPTATRLIQAMGMTGALATGNFYYNSVRIDEDANPTSTCFSSAAKANLKNNIFANFSADGATSTRHCIYNGATLLASNYNDYYIAAGTNNYVGYSGSSYASLADWQTGTSKDAQSISSDPLFTSATNLFPTNVALAAGTPIAGITTDIAGNTRSATSPSMGAYELPASLTWNGSADSDWNTATNWTPNAIPTAASDVSIPDVTTNPMVNQPAASPAQCNNITIEAGAVLTINTGKALTISGTLTNNAETAGLVVKSGGSLITNTAGVNATVETDIVNTDFHFISSPIASTTFGNVFPLNQSNVWARAYNETSGDWDNLAIADFLSVGKGYSVQMDQPQTAMFAGVLNSSPLTLTLANQNPGSDPNRTGWNLLGNPYSAAIDWDLTDHSAIDGSVYVWTGSQYITWNGTVGSLSDGIIPAQNGFLAKTTIDGASFSIPLSSRIHSGTGFYKSAVTNLLELTVEGDNSTDKTYIHFNDQASAGFDTQYDAYKLFGKDNAPQLYSLIKGDILSINELPMDGNEVVELGFKCNTAGLYKVSALGIGNFPSNVPVYLKDNKLNIVQDLRKNPVYSFSYEVGESENRFDLSFTQTIGIGETENKIIRIFSSDCNVVIDNAGDFSGIASVYDMTGRLVCSQPLASQARTTIPVHAATGIYVVKVLTASGAVTARVVIR
jgi:hypothetical protein